VPLVAKHLSASGVWTMTLDAVQWAAYQSDHNRCGGLISDHPARRSHQLETVLSAGGIGEST
jgi:hypothetical protein